jgi:4'-phosphopantetheinyl transferase
VRGETTWRGVTIAWMPATESHGLDPADLGSAQLARFRRLHGASADGFLAGRALIRDLSERMLPGAFRMLDSVCARCGEAHGRPRLAGLGLSVSHAGDLVVVAVSATAADVGVDVELAQASDRMAELHPLFPGGAVPDLAGWTRIEAVLKADGRGLAVDPGAVRLHPDPVPRPIPEWSAAIPDGVETIVATLPGPVGAVLSVAVRGASQP